MCGAAWAETSILFYSILFYSILFDARRRSHQGSKSDGAVSSERKLPEPEDAPVGPPSLKELLVKESLLVRVTAVRAALEQLVRHRCGERIECSGTQMRQLVRGQHSGMTNPPEEPSLVSAKCACTYPTVF